MKNLLTLLVLCLSNFAISQVYGEIFMDKRDVATEFTFTIEHTKEATLVFDIRVNKDGKVTSCVLNEERSTTASYPVMMKAKNKIMSQLKFNTGIGYPEFHQGYVQMKTVQSDSISKPDPFAPPF